MADYDNTNTGAIFVNDKKTSDKHPDRKGSLNVNGEEFWLSGWLKKDKNGNPFMSLAVTPKEQQAAPTAKQVPSARNGAAFDDEIPFAPLDWRV